MRHRVFGKKLNRNTSQRRALFINLAKAVFLHGRIETSLAKAKALRAVVEKVITQGKKGDLASYRKILAFFRGDKEIAKKIVEEIAPVYKERKGGYTRIIKGGFRLKDDCSMAYLELVDMEEKKVEKDVRLPAGRKEKNVEKGD